MVAAASHEIRQVLFAPAVPGVLPAPDRSKSEVPKRSARRLRVNLAISPWVLPRLVICLGVGEQKAALVRDQSRISVGVVEAPWYVRVMGLTLQLAAYTIVPLIIENSRPEVVPI